MRGAEEELEGDSPKEKREEEEGEEEEERRKSAGEGKKEARLDSGERDPHPSTRTPERRPEEPRSSGPPPTVFTMHS